MKHYIYFALCSVFLFCSCKNQEYTFKDENIEIDIRGITIKKIEHNEYKIKGIVQVKNLTDKNYCFNLRNIKLKTSSDTNYEVYIDSIASVLIERQEIKPYATYTKNVYWIVYSDNELSIEGIDYHD